eukprot:6301829-Prymnesium_polylepis.2
MVADCSFTGPGSFYIWQPNSTSAVIGLRACFRNNDTKRYFHDQPLVLGTDYTDVFTTTKRAGGSCRAATNCRAEAKPHNVVARRRLNGTGRRRELV